MGETEQPLVSVLVPVFHVEEYIERCARSIFGQTYKNIEYVIVDDGTDDTSIEILNSVIEDYPERKTRTSVIHHKEHKGLAAARNTAVAACNGEFIFHVDSDDWVESNAVELLVKKQRETKADIVSAEAYNYLNHKKTNHLTGGWNLDKNSLLTGLLTFSISTTMWRRLIRRTLYTDNNIACDERGSYGEDFQVLPRLVYYATIVSGIENHIYYHDTSNNNSITNLSKNLIETQLQNMVSDDVVVRFFSDKESFLKNIVDGLYTRRVHQWMVRNAMFKHKTGYKLFLKYMKASDPAYWKMVHWDNSLYKCLESNYYSMRLLLLVQKTFHKVF